MGTLTTEALDLIHAAALPLAPSSRKPFIDEMVRTLEGVPVLGDGVVHRAIVEVQRRHWDAPRMETAPSRWSR